MQHYISGLMHPRTLTLMVILINPRWFLNNQFSRFELWFLSLSHVTWLSRRFYNFRILIFKGLEQLRKKDSTHLHDTSSRDGDHTDHTRLSRDIVKSCDDFQSRAYEKKENSRVLETPPCTKPRWQIQFLIWADKGGLDKGWIEESRWLTVFSIRNSNSKRHKYS